MAAITLTELQNPSVTPARLREAIPVADGVEDNRLFVEGEHWNGGDFWVGPGPKPSDPTYSDIIPLIERAFVSKNVVDEIIDRHVSSCLGKEPRWSWTPIVPPKDGDDLLPADETAIGELEAALTTWWDNRQVHRWLKTMIYRMLWGQRGTWRLYVPSGLQGANGSVAATELPDALAKLFLDIPQPEDAGIWEDPETKTRVGIVLWKDGDGKEHGEVTYVGVDGKTVINLVPPGAGLSTATNDFSGNMPIGTTELDAPWVTGQMRALQKALNMSLTLLSKALQDNAFLERLLLNALPPGHWEYEDQPDPVTGEKIRKAYVADRHQAGGRQTTYVSGIDYSEKSQDGSTKTTVKDPSVVFRDPTDPEAIIKGTSYWYQALIGEARQDHVLINQDATPSGKSREQARGDFMDSTQDTQLQTELAGRALFLTVVAMAETILNKPGFWTKKYKPIFKCRTSYGPLAVEERAQNVAEAKDGFMSDETAMALNGIDDVDAEQLAIQNQPRSSLGLSENQATVVDLWVTAGFARETALHLAGFSDEEIADIMKRESDAMPVADPITGLLPGDPGADPTDPNAPPIPVKKPVPPVPPTPATPPAAAA